MENQDKGFITRRHPVRPITALGAFTVPHGWGAPQQGSPSRGATALLARMPASSDHDGYRGCIVAQAPTGKSRELLEKATQYVVSIR